MISLPFSAWEVGGLIFSLYIVLLFTHGCIFASALGGLSSTTWRRRSFTCLLCCHSLLCGREGLHSRLSLCRGGSAVSFSWRRLMPPLPPLPACLSACLPSLLTILMVDMLLLSLHLSFVTWNISLRATCLPLPHPCLILLHLPGLHSSLSLLSSRRSHSFMGSCLDA